MKWKRVLVEGNPGLILPEIHKKVFIRYDEGSELESDDFEYIQQLYYNGWEDIEWLDLEAPSYTIDDLRKAFEAGRASGPHRLGDIEFYDGDKGILYNNLYEKPEDYLETLPTDTSTPSFTEEEVLLLAQYGDYFFGNHDKFGDKGNIQIAREWLTKRLNKA